MTDSFGDTDVQRQYRGHQSNDLRPQGPLALHKAVTKFRDYQMDQAPHRIKPILRSTWGRRIVPMRPVTVQIALMPAMKGLSGDVDS